MGKKLIIYLATIVDSTKPSQIPAFSVSLVGGFSLSLAVLKFIGQVGVFEQKVRMEIVNPLGQHVHIHRHTLTHTKQAHKVRAILKESAQSKLQMKGCSS